MRQKHSVLQPEGSCLKLLPSAGLLTPEEFAELEDNCTRVHYQKKDIIFRQGEPTAHIMLQLTGLVKIYMEGKNKRNILLKISQPGYFIGLLSQMGEQIHQYSASAVEECDITYIDFNSFKNVLLYFCNDIYHSGSWLNWRVLPRKALSAP